MRNVSRGGDMEKKVCGNCKFYVLITNLYGDFRCGCECPKFILGYNCKIGALDEVLVENDEGWGFYPGREFGCIHWERKNG